MKKISIPVITFNPARTVLCSGGQPSVVPPSSDPEQGGEDVVDPDDGGGEVVNPDEGGDDTPPEQGGESQAPSEVIVSLPYIETTYDVKSATTAAKVLYSSYFISYGIDHMLFDGEEFPSATSFKFNSVGEHTVRVVTAVAANTAYYGCSLMTKAVIPAGITRIGDQAFRSCAILRDITIPDTIKTVGNNVFDVFSDGVIRINGELTDVLRELITKYFMGCQLYVNGELTPGIL